MAKTMEELIGFNFTNPTHADTYPEIDPVTKSDLRGKYVFITGASKGIGRSCALSYAKAGAAAIGVGARSDLSSLEKDIQDAAAQAGKDVPRFLAVKLDITDQASVEQAAKEVEAGFGKLDILINNAGYLEEGRPIAESDPDEWWKTYTTNVRGPYLMTRSLLPLLLKGGDKQIINITSAGAHGTTPGLSGYQSSKLAILRFSEFINVEYGEQGILSYGVHPGGIMTELAQAMPKHMHHILGDTLEMAGDSIVYLTQKREEWLAGRYVSCAWDLPDLYSKKAQIVEQDLLKVRMAL